MSFPEQPPEQARIESDALRRIATGLGSKYAWDGGMELEWIAMAVAEAGLPHPGYNGNTPFYQEQAEQ